MNMNLVKLLTPYEQSVELKELGFNEPCFGYYNSKKEITFNTNGSLVTKDWLWKGNECLPTDMTISPTYSQAFRWFREKYNLQCWVEPTASDRYSCRYDGNDETGYRWVGYLRDINHEILYYSNPEEAEFECLIKLIEIVKIINHE